MEQLIELLQQIQDLAGVAIDALNEAAGALARGQRRAGQALTGTTTGGEGNGDDGIEPISLRNGDQVLVEPRTVQRGCAGNVDNDRHRKSSNMSVLPVPRHGSWAV